MQDIASFDAAPLGDTVCAVNASPFAPSSTLLFSACMEFQLDSIQGLGNLMPALMLIDAGGQRYPGLMPILAVMEREVSSARVGLCRHPCAPGRCGGGDDRAGLGRVRLRQCFGSRGRVARHPPGRRPARPAPATGRDWSVAELAAHCHTSRSVFADRFQATLGVPPLRYVTELRMRLASQWLTLERLPIEEVAYRLGYTSQAAFSRAYKRITGQPPGASRQGFRSPA